MSRKKSLPDWHDSKGFQIDMSLFDGPSDKIVDKPMPTSQVATKGKTAAWQAISGVTGLGKTFQARNPLDSVINADDESGNPESGHPTMGLIISELPPKEEKGGASRKMRKSKKTKKSRRARRVKTQMRRKNSSRKSTRRRTRK